MAPFEFILPVILSPTQVLVTYEESGLKICAASDQAQSACPLCGQCSTRIHSNYTRYFADLPVFGHLVQVILKVRKFVCSNADCDRKIFTERFSSDILPYSRRFNRIKKKTVLILDHASIHQNRRMQQRKRSGREKAYSYNFYHLIALNSIRSNR